MDQPVPPDVAWCVDMARHHRALAKFMAGVANSADFTSSTSAANLTNSTNIINLSNGGLSAPTHNLLSDTYIRRALILMHNALP